MPNYMLVDADQLEADLTTVAESIRAKGGTTEPLAFPEEFKKAVEAIVIKTGTEIQKKTGTVRGGSSINCGWKPDLVYLAPGGSDNGYPITACMAFEAAGQDKLNTTTWISNEQIADIYGSRTSTGFSFSAKTYGADWSENDYRGNFSYIAVKYTE